MRNLYIIQVDTLNDCWLVFDAEDIDDKEVGSGREATIGRFILNYKDTDGAINIKSLQEVDWRV